MRFIQADAGKELPIMWLPDPVTGLELCAALLSSIAAAIAIVQRIRTPGRRGDRDDNDDHPS